MSQLKKRWSKVAALMMLLSSTTVAHAQQEALWIRYPAISPDAKTLVFGYKGNLYKVSTAGGTATALTVGSSHAMMPVWSRDGKTLAFANNRYGNFDVFTMPADGGAVTRVTYHSSNDYPYDFTVDNKDVIFGSARQAPAASVRFPSVRLFQNLYQASKQGGRAKLLSAAGVENAHFNGDGSKLVFQDRKGYEDPWRKHHKSAVTRDIWIYDLKSSNYQALTQAEIEHREPVFSADGQAVFYLNEQDGTQNIYKKNLGATTADKQLTTFTKNPVRHLSIAKDNTMAFTQDGQVYILKEGGKAQKITIQVPVDVGDMERNFTNLASQVSQYQLSPNNKEIAYISRGEVFVTSVEGDFTKRITSTSSQERMVQWAPDGKSLIYAAERGTAGWGIYESRLKDTEEGHFFQGTIFVETPLIVNKNDNFAPKFSPNGEKIAYVEERNILQVFDIKSKKTTTLLPKGHNHSYSDGDWSFSWSPDSKWLLVDDQKGYFGGSNAALIKADGSTPIQYPINSGFGEDNARWQMDGKLITWESARYGRKSLANQGSREVDVLGVFLNPEDFDKFNLSKDEFDLFKDGADKKKEEPAKDKDTNKKDAEKGKDSRGDNKDDSSKNKVADLKLNLENLRDREVRLTINSSSIADYMLTKDGEKLFYLAAFEKGYDLWQTDTRTRETKILAKLGGSPSGIQLSKDEKFIIVSNRGSLLKIEVASGKPTAIKNNPEMELNTAAERQYIFDHAWLQVKKKFYDPTIHGIDWKGYYDTYNKFLPHINNNYDFQELLSELLGELNGSHTGGRYSPRMAAADQTASLGLLYDELYTGKGLKVAEVIAGGPFSKAASKLTAGSIIHSIDGLEITDQTDWAALLNRKSGKFVKISGQTAAGAAFTETVKPIDFGEENTLMYKRWVASMEAYVAKISNGKIGYVHVEGMNDGAFREVFDKVMGDNKEKEALIVDTRFNGGGWLHDDLNTFLSGKEYMKFSPQGTILKGGEPMARWTKPSAVVMSEGNYSDAFIFPYIYKQNGLGKLIGMPVPGTGTAVWWETQIDPTLVFGIPMVGTVGTDGRTTENLQVEPDIRVPLPYEAFLKGEDPQLERAVKELLKK
ncbi:PD40 domain-containing protein [Sphingobacteriaceae bacterium WQ 2009]|uniref:Tricorn protease homolog n=1 Tax=Rhinopithecimicrobium faecis TaxID=2820698 RepID=A0A8T4HDW4_9SPHI|nr:PD40 domain-containing protein [Sphingobacteriaceae bacterium WQ 2009]